MNTLDAIKTRRSVRRYTTKEVPPQTIEEIVNLATYAPSWKNSQTTRYTAVLNSDLKKKIANECVLDFDGNKKIIDNAPTLIVVTTINNRSGYERDGSPSTSKGNHWQSFDAGIASYTFCLAAHELGLSTIILGIFDEDKILSILNIPDGQSVSALIALGYSEDELAAPPRKDASILLTIK